MLAVGTPSCETLSSIFGSILSFHLQRLPFSPAVVRSGPAVVKAAVALHDRVLQHFLPTSIKFYYLFNLWDLSRLFQVSIPSVLSNLNCKYVELPVFVCASRVSCSPGQSVLHRVQIWFNFGSMNPEEYIQIAFLKHLTFSFSIGCRRTSHDRPRR